MKYTSLDDWKKAATDAGYTLKQIQGFEQYEAHKGGQIVGHFNGEGELPGGVEKTTGPVVFRQPGGNVASGNFVNPKDDPLAAVRAKVRGQ